MDPMEAVSGSPLYSSTTSGANFRKDSMDADTDIERLKSGHLVKEAYVFVTRLLNVINNASKNNSMCLHIYSFYPLL